MVHFPLSLRWWLVKSREHKKQAGSFLVFHSSVIMVCRVHLALKEMRHYAVKTHPGMERSLQSGLFLEHIPPTSLKLLLEPCWFLTSWGCWDSQTACVFQRHRNYDVHCLASSVAAPHLQPSLNNLGIDISNPCSEDQIKTMYKRHFHFLVSWGSALHSSMYMVKRNPGPVGSNHITSCLRVPDLSSGFSHFKGWVKGCGLSI